MIVSIPSARRSDRVLVVNSLLGAVPKKDLFIFVPPSEVKAYEKSLGDRATIVSCVAQKEGVSSVRDYIVGHAHKLGHREVCMMDDDLSFFKWGPPRGEQKTPLSLYECEKKDIVQMLAALRNRISEGYGAASILSRGGSNRFAEMALKGEDSECVRHNGFHVFDVRWLKDRSIRFSEMKFMEDFHVQLSILESGKKTICLTKWIQDPNGINTPGGCSTYRTKEGQEAAAYRLKELHPAFVSVRVKKMKCDWGDMGNERIDVVVRWKDAYKFGSML